MNREKNKQTCTFQYRALSGALQKSKDRHRNQIKSSKVSIQSSYKRRSVAKFILQHQEARTATKVEERDTAHSGDSLLCKCIHNVTTEIYIECRKSDKDNAEQLIVEKHAVS